MPELDAQTCATTAKPLPLTHFLDPAAEFVGETFPDTFPDIPEYSGPELARYRSSPRGDTPAQHQIAIYPSGLIELQWLMTTPPDTELRLPEIINIMRRLHAAARDGKVASIHQRRRYEGRRRLDWRIGVNGRAQPADGSNAIHWTRVTSTGPVPARRVANPHPSCPAAGYTAGSLSTRKRTTLVRNLLAPALEEMLTTAGYLGGEEIRRSVGELFDEAPSALPAGNDHMSPVHGFID